MTEWDAPGELVAEPLVGYRRWNVLLDTLLSLNGVPWPVDGPLAAQCNRQYAPDDRAMLALPGPHRTPGAGKEVGGCDCGVWAYNYKPDPYDIWPHYDSYGRRQVYGAVFMWGRVVECERGYRSEYARVQYLIGGGRGVAPGVRDSLAILALRYGVELRDPPPLPEGSAHVRFRMT